MLLTIFKTFYSISWEISYRSSVIYINVWMQNIPDGLFGVILNIIIPSYFLDNLELLHKFLCTVKISFPVILQMWENKSGAESDPCPVWTWWFLIYMLLSATLLLSVRIIIGSVSGGSFITLLATVVAVVVRIRNVDWWWVWCDLLPVFTTIFLLIHLFLVNWL